MATMSRTWPDMVVKVRVVMWHHVCVWCTLVTESVETYESSPEEQLAKGDSGDDAVLIRPLNPAA